MNKLNLNVRYIFWDLKWWVEILINEWLLNRFRSICSSWFRVRRRRIVLQPKCCHLPFSLKNITSQHSLSVDIRNNYRGWLNYVTFGVRKKPRGEAGILNTLMTVSDHKIFQLIAGIMLRRINCIRIWFTLWNNLMIKIPVIRSPNLWTS